MAARQWTPEQRAAQSKAIQAWQPWHGSTGAKTKVGKAIVSRNAYTGSFRRRMRLCQWLLHQSQQTPSGNDNTTIAHDLTDSIAIRCNPLDVKLSASTQHQQFFTDMTINNVTVAMAIDCKNQQGFYERACVIESAVKIVSGFGVSRFPQG